MLIRKAITTDFKNILELNRAVQKIHATGEPTLFRPAIEMNLSLENFETWLNTRDFLTFVAEINDEFAGYTWAEIVSRKSSKYLLDHQKIYINQLGVLKQFQGQGIGKALLNAVKAEAQRLKIHRVEIDVWSFNQNAKSFYLKNGFKVFQEKLFQMC